MSKRNRKTTFILPKLISLLVVLSASLLAFVGSTMAQKTSDAAYRDATFACLQDVSKKFIWNPETGHWVDIKTGKAVSDSVVGEAWKSVEKGLTDPDRAFNPQTGQNLFWDKKTKTWKDAKTGKSVTPTNAREALFCCLKTLHSKDYIWNPETGHWVDIKTGKAVSSDVVGEAMTSVKRDISDPNRPFDSKTGRNFAWDEDKQAWIDVKTGECVCPKGCPPAKEKEVSMTEKNEATILVNLIREDASPAFNTYGFNTGATHFFNSAFGVTGDFNANFKSEGTVDLKKISVLGGVTFVPFEGVKRDDKVTISLHTLFGVSHFSSGSGTTRFTDNAFTMKLGGAVDVNVTPRFFIRPVQLDYAPTFFGSNTQHNFQYGAGVGFRF